MRRSSKIGRSHKCRHPIESNLAPRTGTVTYLYFGTGRQAADHAKVEPGPARRTEWFPVVTAAFANPVAMAKRPAPSMMDARMSIIWPIEPTVTALRECNVHAVMKGATFGCQRRQSWYGRCHLHMRLVRMRPVHVRIGICRAYRQCRANCHSGK